MINVNSSAYPGTSAIISLMAGNLFNAGLRYQTDMIEILPFPFTHFFLNHASTDFGNVR